MANIFIGYSGLIWQAVYSGLVYYQAQLGLTTDAEQAVSLSEAMFQSLLNGVTAINANTLVQTWQSEAVGLQEIQALPLDIDEYDATILNNRTTAYITAAEALLPLLPQGPFPTPPASLGIGQPIVPDLGLLDFYETFEFESPPAGTNPSNLVANAFSVGTAFNDIATQISIYQGANITSLYDVATRQALVSNVAAQILASFTSGPLGPSTGFSQSPEFLATESNILLVTETGIFLVAGTDGTLAEWNEIVTLPAMTMDASLIGTAPFSYAAQQNGVIRNVMLTVAAQIALFLLILRNPSLTQINLSTVRVGDSLQNIANRSLGDFEQWTSIAAVNGLQPPWIGPVAASGVAGWGQNLLMPSPGTAPSAAGVIPSYQNNFLGIDLYIGPINGAMPPWTGDFQTIAGYSNLSWALGRRLQTTLGMLIYHPDFGSRVPPEVGNIQVQTTAMDITTYATSALLTDPRVAAVLGASSSLLPNGLIQFNGNVQPAGFGTGVLVNEVIGPLS